MSQFIYKICNAAEWRDAAVKGTYRGSVADLRDGFIHFSAADQVMDTLAKHFSDQADLLLIAFAPDSLGPELRFEPSRGGALFPHLYGSLDPTLAVSVTAVPLGDEGHVLPVIAE